MSYRSVLLLSILHYIRMKLMAARPQRMVVALLVPLMVMISTNSTETWYRLW
jgi:hypothetical protein